MTATESRFETDGVVPFVRSYTKSWIHAVATAGLTAFGTLTIVHRWFAALALAAYVVPPVALYLRARRADPDASPADADEAASLESAGSSATGDDADAPAGDSVAATDRPDAGPARPEGAERRNDEPTAPSGAETEPDAEPVDVSEPTSDADLEWRAVDAPTDATLRDVVATAAGAVYAVGDGGTVLAGDDGEWTVALEDGPGAAGENLHGVDATDDGEAIWIAGDSGALGRIDSESGRHVDFTAPGDVTDNWLGVAVGGPAGGETVCLVTGSGAVHRGAYRDGGVEWAEPVTPGSGSSMAAIALADATVGYCCDTNDGVFETTDGGESFERIGLEGADGTLTDVATAGREACLVSADDGVVHRYDGPTWTPERAADGGVSGIATNGDRVVACADDAVLERAASGTDWDRPAVDPAGSLRAVSIAEGAAVAVGTEGTVVASR